MSTNRVYEPIYTANNLYNFYYKRCHLMHLVSVLVNFTVANDPFESQFDVACLQTPIHIDYSVLIDSINDVTVTNY